MTTEEREAGMTSEEAQSERTKDMLAREKMARHKDEMDLKIFSLITEFEELYGLFFDGINIERDKAEDGTEKSVDLKTEFVTR